MLNKISNTLGISVEDSLTLQYIRNLRIHSFSFVLVINIFYGVGKVKTNVLVQHFIYIYSALNYFISVMKVSC